MNTEIELFGPLFWIGIVVAVVCGVVCGLIYIYHMLGKRIKN